MFHGAWGEKHQADDGGSLVSFGDALLYGGLTFSKDISGGFSGVWGLTWSGKLPQRKLKNRNVSFQKKGGSSTMLRLLNVARMLVFLAIGMFFSAFVRRINDAG